MFSNHLRIKTHCVVLNFFKDLETKGGIVSKFKSHFDAVEQELKTSTIGKNKVILQTEANQMLVETKKSYSRNSVKLGNLQSLSCKDFNSLSSETITFSTVL